MPVKIFISHSSADKPVIEALQRVLQLACNLKQQDFFCTSISGMGCSGGDFFNETIRKSLQEASVVVAYLSKNYKQSEFCCAELGATWISRESKLFVPLLDSELDYNVFGGVLNGTHLYKINDRANLLSTVQSIIKTCRSRSDLPYLSDQIDHFIKEYPALKTKVPDPFICTEEQYNALVNARDSLRTTNAELNATIELKEKEIARLKELKDAEEVRNLELENNRDSLQAFKDAAHEVYLKGKEMNSYVRKFIIYDYFGLTVRDCDDEVYREYVKAKDAGYLREPFDGDFRVNEENRHVRKIHSALAQFKDFAESLDDEAARVVEDEYDADFNLNNTEFIDKVLC